MKTKTTIRNLIKTTVEDDDIEFYHNSELNIFCLNKNNIKDKSIVLDKDLINTNSSSDLKRKRI